MIFLFLTGCGYTVKLGKKCTPGHTEWSYVWFIEKDGTECQQRQLRRHWQSKRIDAINRKIKRAARP